MLIQIFGYGEDTAKKADGENVVEEQTIFQQSNEETVDAPLSGHVIPLSDVPKEIIIENIKDSLLDQRLLTVVK